jgi:oxygen-independent coproporphyrinogen-3 oxidase
MTGLFDIMAAEFDLSACREIAVEMDPRTTDAAQIRALAGLGVNRVSLGVQDFNEEVQKLVHRIQPFSMVEKTCADLRASGIDNINFDLMYGLPLQTPDSVAQTARDVCRLQPQRVALFSYAHVPQMKSHQRALEEAGLPDKYARLNMDQAARDVLTAAGYSEIGMDHFARSEDDLAIALSQRGVHRNFQGYTTDANPVLVALGASAISRLGDGYFQNERVATVYQDMIAAGSPPTVRGLRFSREDRVRADIIEELMCYMDCDVAAICNRHGYRLGALSASIAALEEMEQVGLIVRDGYKLRLQAAHRMAVRVVCQAFDTYAAGNVSSRAA